MVTSSCEPQDTVFFGFPVFLLIFLPNDDVSREDAPEEGVDTSLDASRAVPDIAVDAVTVTSCCQPCSELTLGRVIMSSEAKDSGVSNRLAGGIPSLSVISTAPSNKGCMG